MEYHREADEPEPEYDNELLDQISTDEAMADALQDEDEEHRRDEDEERRRICCAKKHQAC